MATDYLEVSNGALRIDGCESVAAMSREDWGGGRICEDEGGVHSRVVSCPLFVCPSSGVWLLVHMCAEFCLISSFFFFPCRGHSPTFELASVSALSVVDFPLDGLPTRPMRGSRGMAGYSVRCYQVCVLRLVM